MEGNFLFGPFDWTSALAPTFGRWHWGVYPRRVALQRGSCSRLIGTVPDDHLVSDMQNTMMMAVEDVEDPGRRD